MKIILKRIIGTTATVCIIIAGLYGITELTRIKESYARDLSYKSYFECPDEYDVLFLGTSHVMHGVNPLVVWNESGITSYNWATPTCTIPMIYWKLNCILETAKPEMVVVDCFRANWSDKGYSIERMHQSFDAFPLSYTKYQAIQDLMSDTEKYSEQDRFNVLFPLGAYHTRWDDLHRIDFNNEFLDVKGCEFETDVAVPIEISNTSEKLEITDEMVGVTYLRKIIEECQENDIEILLTYLPYPTDVFWKMESNMISDIAAEYDVNYLNFTDMDVVNYDTDYSDPDSHMNCAGQVKVSRYLAKYLYENYGIEDRRNDLAIAEGWNNLYNCYINSSCDRIKTVNDLPGYLMLTYDLPFEFFIDVRKPEIFDDKVYEGLLEQLGVDISQVNGSTDFIIKQNGTWVVLNDFRNNGCTLQTDIGEFSLSYYEEEQKFGLYLDGEELYTSEADEYDMKINVIKSDNNLFDSVLLKYDISEDLNISITQFDRN